MPSAVKCYDASEGGDLSQSMLGSSQNYGPPLVLDYMIRHLLLRGTKIMGPQFWKLGSASPEPGVKAL